MTDFGAVPDSSHGGRLRQRLDGRVLGAALVVVICCSGGPFDRTLDSERADLRSGEGSGRRSGFDLGIDVRLGSEPLPPDSFLRVVVSVGIEGPGDTEADDSGLMDTGSIGDSGAPNPVLWSTTVAAGVPGDGYSYIVDECGRYHPFEVVEYSSYSLLVADVRVQFGRSLDCAVNERFDSDCLLEGGECSSSFVVSIGEEYQGLVIDDAVGVKLVFDHSASGYCAGAGTVYGQIHVEQYE